jgi:parallel beta-helix repeat protein
MGGFTTPPVETRTATVVVAAYNSLHPEKADYRCDGVDDHVEIQAALNSLPSTGGQVILLDGTFNIQSTIGRNISNITIRGQGKSTVLTTTTSGLTFFSFTGTSGSELTGITISDMVIDGANSGHIGIYFEYVDKSLIQNVLIKRFSGISGLADIELYNSDFNQITDNVISEGRYYGIYLYTSTNNVIANNIIKENQHNGIYITNNSNDNTITGNILYRTTYSDGIYLTYSYNNTISGNTCTENGDSGIAFYYSDNNSVVGNTCKGNDYGIYLDTSNYNIITGNVCQESRFEGLDLYSSNHNSIIGNTCIANSQYGDGAYDNVYLEDSSYNTIQCNTIRAGTLANKPDYGIDIYNSGCVGNMVTNNDIYNDGFRSGSFYNGGTGTVTAAGNRT